MLCLERERVGPGGAVLGGDLYGNCLVPGWHVEGVRGVIEAVGDDDVAVDGDLGVCAGVVETDIDEERRVVPNGCRVLGDRGAERRRQDEVVEFEVLKHERGDRRVRRGGLVDHDLVERLPAAVLGGDQDLEQVDAGSDAAELRAAGL